MTGIKNTGQEVQLLDEKMQSFKELLMADGHNVGPLWTAWHYLQVYSIWGVHLPSNEDDLNLALGINDPMAYSFYVQLLDSLKLINASGKHFSAELFPKVVKVGQRIRSFGEEAGAMETGTLSVIIDLIDQKGSEQEVIDLISGLKQQADQNAAEAKAVDVELKAYGKSLDEAGKSMSKAIKLIAEDEHSSDESIAVLKAGPEVKGSLANLQQMIDASREDYDQNVLIASTTPTYVWVFPYGTLAAVIVAGIYGDRAVKTLEQYNLKRKEYEALDEELSIALKTNEVALTAKTGMDKARFYTDFAIEQVEIVQEAWEGLSESLGLVILKVQQMTTTVGERDRLRPKSRVKTYARRSGAQWKQLWPAIEQLTDKPYVKVAADESTIQDAIEAIQAANNNNKPNSK